MHAFSTFNARSYTNPHLATFALVSIFFASAIFPHAVFADTVVVPTQVIPPTLAACAPVQVSALTPYIYNGSLNSFDITISDPHYVAILGEVGGEAVPFHFFNRTITPEGRLKIHADIFSTRIVGDLPIQITLISSDAGSTCITVVKSIVPGTLSIAGSNDTGYTGNLEAGQGSTQGHGNSTGSGTGGVTHVVKHPTTGTGTPSSTVVVGAPIVAHGPVAKLCATGGATGLWVILLALFALFVIVLLIQRQSPADHYMREWNIALILGIFVALLIFWYVSAICRAGSWVPAVSTLIACLGVLAHMFKSDGDEDILLLEEHPKKK